MTEIKWREGVLRPKKKKATSLKMTSESWKLVRYFKPEEFKCPCCGRCEMDGELIFMLDLLRAVCGFPLIVTSGFRCKKYNEAIGGEENSAHLRGKAADIYCLSQIKRYEILKNALLLGFRRIGIGKNFIHLDVDITLPYPRIWVYPHSKQNRRCKKNETGNHTS